MTRVRAAVAVLALLGLVAAAGCRRQAQPDDSEPQQLIVPVGAIRAATAGIRAVVRASGVVAPAEGAEFLAVPPEPARILEITKAEKDPVASGELLVRFELTGANQDVARIEADLAAAQALLENARVNQERMRDFVQRGLVPRRDLENAERELADAQASVDRVRAAHQKAVAAAARASVRAPFDGIVANRFHNPGDIVVSTNADPVLRVVDPTRLDLIALVPEADAPRVVTGATARIPAPGGMPVQLHVSKRLSERPGPDGSVQFLLMFDMPTDLPVDTRVELEIDAEERTDVVVVPIEALIVEGARTAVMIANGSQAERRPVTVGIQDEGRAEITEGIEPGELVITRGHIGLADGAEVSVAVE